MDTRSFFAALLTDFTRLAPTASKVRQALVDAGEQVVDDHVAFRTFDRGPLGPHALERPLLELGYECIAPHQFPDKHLRARGHVRSTDPDAPRIFVSELLVGELSLPARSLVDRLVGDIPSTVRADHDVFTAGRLWAPLSHRQYLRLREESEYAAWGAAHGMHANHFTIQVNRLSRPLRSVEDVLRFVEDPGLRVNDSGGRVKGAPQVLLEQGSTMVDAGPVRFADGTHLVPGGFYELALRHEITPGRLFPGFVAANADRIFELTYGRPRAA